MTKSQAPRSSGDTRAAHGGGKGPGCKSLSLCHVLALQIQATPCSALCPGGPGGVAHSCGLPGALASGQPQPVGGADRRQDRVQEVPLLPSCWLHHPHSPMKTKVPFQRPLPVTTRCGPPWPSLLHVGGWSGLPAVTHPRDCTTPCWFP